MRVLITFFVIVFGSVQIVQAEQILRWTLLPLEDEDYNDIQLSDECRSFAGVIKNARVEWPHITPFKFSQETLKYFLLGYNTKEALDADIVTVWPEYRERIAKWYVLIGYQNCFVKWFNILPNELQDIIDIGFKKK